jgi:diguanylate cyclase (GGDEF)-like protein/PAS domain S-box-containing protein
MEDTAYELGDLSETTFAYDLTLFPIHEAAGQVRAVVSFTRDITERKEAEHARMLAEERLRLLLSNMPLVMFAIDAEGIITFADGKFLDVPGRRPGDIIGTSIFDFNQGRPEVLANIRRGLDGEAFVTSAPFGGQFFESRYSPVRDAEGKLAGLAWVSIDISERVEAEKKLRESEERYRKTFEGLHDVFYQTNLRDEFTMVSPSMETANGWTPEEIAGTFSRALYVNPADHDVLVARIMTGVPVDDFEAMMRRRDGSTYPVSLNAKLVLNEAGKPVAVQGTARDITARKRAEDALRESEERYRSTFESLHDVFYQTDKAGLVTIVSPSCLRHTGYTVDELVGQHVSSVFVHMEEFSGLLASLLEHGAVNDYAASMRTKAGVEVPVSVNGTMLRSENGRIRGFQGTLRDITERKRVEDERDRIFTLSVDMLSVILAGGVITRVNPAWGTTLGYSEADLIGQNVFDFVHPSERRQTMREASQVDRGKPVTDLRARFRHKDGTWRWLSWSIAAISAEDTTYCVARDVTELMQAQQTMFDTRDELEESLEAMHASQRALQEQADELDRLRINAEHLAGHDMLTGVLNRRAWFAQAVQVKPTAIAIFDIDHFKRVNDTYGHPAGDEVLRQVAARLHSALPEGALLGRLGGEEFGALFTGDFAEARASAALAVAAVGAIPVTIDGAISLTVTISGGVAPWRAGANSREESLAITYEEADAALYEAKGSGRHRLIVRGLKAA